MLDFAALNIHIHSAASYKGTGFLLYIQFIHNYYYIECTLHIYYYYYQFSWTQQKTCTRREKKERP
jgi:hypothetical protein